MIIFVQAAATTSLEVCAVADADEVVCCSLLVGAVCCVFFYSEADAKRFAIGNSKYRIPVFLPDGMHKRYWMRHIRKKVPY